MKSLQNYINETLKRSQSEHINEVLSRSQSDRINEWKYSKNANIDKKPIFKEHPKDENELRKLVIQRLIENNENPYLLDIDISHVKSLNNLFSFARGVENDYAGDHYDYLYKVKDLDMTKLKRIDLSTWDVSNIQFIRRLFCRCEYLEEIIGIENWNLTNCNDFIGMFRCCEKLKTLNISNWKLKGTESKSWMFGNCKSLEEIKGIDNLKPHGGTYDLTYMFIGCNEKVIPSWYDKKRWEAN